MTQHPARRALVRRLVTAAALVAVASVALSGCLYSMIPAPTPRPSTSVAADTTGIAPDLLPFYTQTLHWKSCGGGFDCVDLKAPLDWSQPSGRTISLALIRQRALGGAPIGSLLVNPGGPGVSGVDYVRDSISGAVSTKLQQSFDVVGFDPRGVQHSTAVHCYDDKQLDSFLFDLLPGARGSAQWTQATNQRFAAFGAACKAGSNGILPFITTENAARDLDLMRGVLGDAKLNYLGYSYGTFLGATYAGLFPQRVGRMVLDGALDPSTSGLDVSTVQGIGFESALRAYMAYCLKQRDCPFRGTVDDAMSDVGTLLASLDRRPIKASDGRLLGADTMVTAIDLPLYSRDSWSALTDLFTAVQGGGADEAFYLADIYYDRAQDGAYSSNLFQVFPSYNCMDYPVTTDQAAIDAAQAKLRQQAPVLAPYLIGPDTCAQWPYASTRTPARITAEGAAPIVVVGTTNDPATPYVWAQGLAAQLSSGVLITRVGEGHTGYNKGNDCVDTAVETYLLKGTAPTADITCK